MKYTYDKAVVTQHEIKPSEIYKHSDIQSRLANVFLDYKIVDFRIPVEGERYIVCTGVYVDTVTTEKFARDEPRFIVVRKNPKDAPFPEWE